MLEVLKNVYVDDGAVKGITRTPDELTVNFKDKSTVSIKLKNCTPINKADMSVRAFNALRANDIYCLEDIPAKRKEILRLVGVGRKTAHELYKLVRS